MGMRFSARVPKSSSYRMALLSRRTVAIVCLVAFLFGASSRIVAQDDIQFSASVDNTSISTDDLLTLELRLSGAFQSYDQPQMPPLDGFVVVGTSQSSQFSLVNNTISTQVAFIYRLQPTKIGTLTIPAIPIGVKGNTYHTEPMTVEVTQGAAPRPQQPTSEAPPSSSAPSQLAGQDIYVEASLDNDAPVVGQQITYSFRLYQAVNLSGQPRLDWPDFSGFIGYDLTPNLQYYEEVGGRNYLVTAVRRALFPTTQGQITIGPSILTISGGFFTRDTRLQTQPVRLAVRPLPEGMPEGFSGLVGQYEIESWVEPTESRVNEPVTLFVRVQGVGDVSLAPDPTGGDGAELTGWRVYDAQITTNVEQEGDRIRGARLFERPLVPKTEGDLLIPGFGLDFFDSEAGQYRHVETTPLVVSVAPGEPQVRGPIVVGEGKQDVVVLTTDIRHLKAAPPSLFLNGASLFERPLYWLGWVIPLVSTVGCLVWDWRRRRLEGDTAYARALRARRVAAKRLKGARKLIRADADGAYAAIAHALNAYLADKFNLPVAGLTRDAAREALVARSIPEALVERCLASLDWVDSGRFAPVAVEGEAVDVIGEVEKLIADLEERMA
jgi:hypothetical protein